MSDIGAHGATRFFEGTLPRRLGARADVFDRTRGTLAVIVHGEGEWTVTFGDHRAPHAIVAGASLDADCVAVFSIEGFEALLDGRVGETPAVIGDARLVGRLGQLLVEPAKGMLGARLAAVGAR